MALAIVRSHSRWPRPSCKPALRSASVTSASSSAPAPTSVPRAKLGPVQLMVSSALYGSA